MSTKLDLAIKEFDPTKKGTFVGCKTKRDVFLQIYIEKLYGDQLHYLKFTLITVIFVEEYDDYENTADPMLWDKNKKTLWVLNEVPEEYISKYRKTNKRFTLYPFSLQAINDKESGHIFYILYDKKYNKIEFFDNTTHIVDVMKYNFDIITDFFKRIYGIHVKFELMNYGCILSDYELEYCKSEKYLYKSTGYCMIWFLWFLELRLKNRNLSNKEIVYKIKDILDKKPTKICEILIGYAQFVDKLTNDYKAVIIDNKLDRIEMKSSVKNAKRKRRVTGLVASLIVLLSSIYIFRKNLIFISRSGRNHQ